LETGLASHGNEFRFCKPIGFEDGSSSDDSYYSADVITMSIERLSIESMCAELLTHFYNKLEIAVEINAVLCEIQ
jgi:hypothetical protein